MTRLIPLFALTQLAGCIIYEKDVVHHGPHGGCYDCGWYDTGDSGPVEDPDTAWTLDPNEIGAGETAILSLTSLPASDYGTISGLEFYGDVVVCTTQARDEELLVTVSADAMAAAGPVDLVIEFTDGTAVWVDDALTVIGANGEQPDGGGSSGGSGGGSGDGSGDGSGGTDDGSDDGADTTGCG